MLRLFDSNNQEITNEPTQFCGKPDCLGEPWCTAWGICSSMELEDNDNFVDSLFLELSQQTNNCGSTPESNSSTASTEPPATKKKRLFAPIKTDKEVEESRFSGIPLKTVQDTKYCIGLWESWACFRADENGDTIGPIESLSREELQYWLSRFILEVRKKDGAEFPPNTLHHIVCGIMRHLRWKSIDFITDGDFIDFKRSLDAEMKRLQSKGLGSTKRQAEILTRDDEEKLWREGLLGDTTPQQLLDTLIFYNGLYFALRSGMEHRQLRQSPCQIQLVEKEGDRPHLIYTEDTSKNRPGGLKARKLKPKVVTHYSNIDHPDKCFVYLFKKYTSLCPQGASAFYLQPASHPTDKQWYTLKPVGHNSITKTISRLCKSAGIGGYKTNHSLRATAATRLYESGVDEQMVMEVTGHRSLEGVRSYKRTSGLQRKVLSDILNNTSKDPTLPQNKQPQTPQNQQLQLVTQPNVSRSHLSSIEKQEVSIPSHPASITDTHVETNTKNNTPGHNNMFNFNSCTSVTFNINY